MSQNTPTQKKAQVHSKKAQVGHRSAPGEGDTDATAKGHLHRFPKTDVRYWKDAIRRTKWQSEDGIGVSKTFSVQIKFKHQRLRFSRSGKALSTQQRRWPATFTSPY